MSPLSRLLVALCVVLCAGSVHASARDLQAVDEIKHEQVLYNASVVGTDPLNKLPFSDPRLQRTASGLEPEQIHLTYVSDTEIVVSWATGEGNLTMSPVDPDHFTKQSGPSSTVSWGTQPGVYTDNLTANAATITFYNQIYSFVNANPNYNYSSPLFHHVVLSELEPNTTYYYKVGEPTFGESQEFNFTSPPEVGNTSYPFVLGVIADPGLTANTTVTVEHLVRDNPHVWTLIGDFSYADDMQTNGVANGTQFQSYIARNPTNIAANRSGSNSPLWYSVNAGPAHMIYLSNYDDFAVGSDQYNWLVEDVESFDRESTPWLIATFHAPWYSSYTAHYKENECMRLAMEDVLYEAGVDVVLNGHNHAYERSNPVYNFTMDPCGTVHITMGDGGNIEGVYKTFADQPGFCPAANKTIPKYQPGGFCPTYVYDGEFCATSQPEWSAFREPAYGHGVLTFENKTHAHWQWNRNLDNNSVEMDSVYVIRDLTCQNEANSLEQDSVQPAHQCLYGQGSKLQVKAATMIPGASCL
ncbi:hypothetical protein ABBQ38_012945 [Trebouxia sp. C0009 RCD-2024]